MTRDGRLLLLLALLMAYGLLAVESRYHREDSPLEPRRHRHRHRHETSISRRNHHEPVDRRSSSSWSRELDYDEYDDLNEDSRQDDDEYDGDDEDYEGIRSYEERLYPRSRGKSYQERIYESRYPRRHRENYYGWYHDEEKRRISMRYNWKNRHRSRLERLGRNRHRGTAGGGGGGGGSGGGDGSGGGSSYSRNREAFRDDFSEENDEEEEERSARRYDDDTGPDNHYSSSSYSPWRNSKKQRSNWRRDWRGNRQSSVGYRNGKKFYDATGIDLDSTRKFRLEDQRRRRTNLTERILEDYVESEKEDEEEDDIWKEAEKEEEEDDGTGNVDDDVDVDEELDNDFYKNENKPPLNSYDDIIRRLTSEDPSTAKPTVKRDYRNVGIEKYPLRVSYNSNNSGSRNLTRPKVVGSSYVTSASSYLVNKKPSKGEEVVDMRVSMIKSASAEIERKPTKNVISVVVKDDDEHSGKAKTKSLEQEYDDYLNTEDNEKEEDLIKAGVDDDSGMQSDVTNTDYNDNETADKHERTMSTTTTTTSTTTTSSTTTTTTTTPKPTLTQHFDYRDSRAYDSSTGAQYNGYQAKNDYPPMSAHSVHKWQSLGTRKGVKETRSKTEQYNKNGKAAQIEDALQYAKKVSKEGNCQWPRPRVIPVRDVYPSPSTTYIPHCAILHRCSDDTGCCRSEALTCVPKHSHRVELSFYMTSILGSSVVEKLSFYNHTECECREKSEYDTNEKSLEQRFYRHHQLSPQPQNIRRAPPRKPCRCPSEFTPKITLDGECQCYCYEYNQNCIKTKRGKGYFSLSDRLCIQNNECVIPICEFGEYMRREGKCPRKRDKFDAILNFGTSFNHRYRS
ncbi:uncharacterized protein DDB_G0283697-like isoform X1 [Polistes fuscatus]|uniref:uncharacterized protein DDB_G0283697-like isoform X1 n=1 Tax=Polistes fuscatus TaxID=30207 RepID=UPI001CA7B84D|nr:uncharacterized protein DDB_G0283697-like isoform X1 [Polistes fuscatus]